MYCVTFKGLNGAFHGAWKQQNVPPPDANPGWELVNTEVKYCQNLHGFVMFATWVMNEPT